MDRPSFSATSLIPSGLMLGLMLIADGCTGAAGQDSASATGETSTDSASNTGGSTEATTVAETDTNTDTDTDIGCSSASPSALMECVEQPRYEQDLGFIADLRVPGSTHWQAVQDLCADRLSELGYTVELQDYGSGVNVIGTMLGTSDADEQVIVGGHYDHISGCSGADDNATGVAATLEIARILADVPTPRTLVITCWDEEELGLIGSQAQAQLALDAGETITAVFSFDMVGYADTAPGSQTVPGGFDVAFPDLYSSLEEHEFRGDFLFWVSDDTMAPLAAQLESFAGSIDLLAIGASLEDAVKSSDVVADLRRSDHASFWDLDIPAMLLNDTGEFRYSSYHCSDGDDDRLDNAFTVKIIRASTATVAVALGL